MAKRNGHDLPPLSIPSLPNLAYLKTKPRVGTSVGAIARSLDEHGQMEANPILGPNGEQGMRVPREAYVTADELVEMIRVVVREELQTRFLFYVAPTGRTNEAP